MVEMVNFFCLGAKFVLWECLLYDSFPTLSND